MSNTEVTTLQQPSYLDLEPEIADLRRMALLAVQQLHRSVGELKCADDGRYVEVPDAEQTELAVLVVNQVHDMAKALEAKYFKT